MSASPFDPELRTIARVLPRGLGGPRILKVNRAIESFVGSRQRTPADIRIETLGPISVRLHLPPPGTPAPYPGLLWIHGGGYIGGSPSQDDKQCRAFARDLGTVVAAVGYRLAPEHPFPTPLNDCHDGLVWLAQRPDVDPSRIAIGGASAGGGLAAALALLARERGQVDPVFQLLSYPMLDDRTLEAPIATGRFLRAWNSKSNRFGWQCYLGCPPGGPEVNGLAAPARHPDLSGLPPAWVGVGTLDLFHDEDVAYAERLRQAGVPCALHIAGGAFHGFDAVRPGAQVSRAYRASQTTALANAVGC